ncbi:MAG: hypothetical protein KDA96_11785, partial [Planctomycetaceae bacterium]|nr:hypothetical protein [Planctomycetaceae bacterium]
MVALIAILALGTWLRTTQLTSTTFTFDESCSWRISQLPWSAMFDAIARDAHPPLFYVLMRGWLGLFGPSIFAARMFGVVGGVVGVGLTWGLLRELVRQQGPSPSEDGTTQPQVLARKLFPLVGTLLVALDPLHVQLSQEARPYTLGVSLSLISAILLCKVIRQPIRFSNWMGCVVSVALLSWTHYYCLWTVAALLMVLLVEGLIQLRQPEFHTSGQRLLGGLALTIAALQLVWFPWYGTFEFQQTRAHRQLWMPPLTSEQIFTALGKALTSGQDPAFRADDLWWAPIAWGSIGLLSIWRGGRYGRLLGLLAVFPILSTWAYSANVRNILGVRYLVFAQVFCLLATLWLIAGIHRRALRASAIALLIAWTSCWMWSSYVQRIRQAEVPGLTAAIAHIDGQAADALVVVSSPFVYTMTLPVVGE